MTTGVTSYRMFGTRIIEAKGRTCLPVVSLLVLGLASVGFHNPATAQDSQVTLRGRVYASGVLRPLSASRVSIDDGTLSIRSDLNGRFEIGPVSPGKHSLAFDRAGYTARVFRIEVSDTLTGVFDIGVIELMPLETSSTRVEGVVSDVRTSGQVPRVAIALNGEIVAMTDEAGRFTIDSVPRGNNLLEARRIGYAPLSADLDVGDAARDLSIALTLDPLPFRLDDVEVVVEGDKTIYAMGRMRDFYRRRRSTPGAFITREDIERRNPLDVSDMLRTVPGVRITQAGFRRRIRIRGCTPVIYLNGMPLRGVQLDNIASPVHVQAIEVHRGAFLPIEFMTFGSCAVIAIWTR